jgi:outer membrane protein assembly factor BamD (BamD/ComL family)
MCHRQLGETDKAEARFDRLIAGFPDSPYAKAVQAEREERRAREAAGPKTTQTVETGSTKR